MHYTIGSMVGYDAAGEIDPREERALLKVSQFYANRYTFCSPDSSVLSSIVEYEKTSAEEVFI